MSSAYEKHRQRTENQPSLSLTDQLTQADVEENWERVIEIGEQLLSKDKNHRLARTKTSLAYDERGDAAFCEGYYAEAKSDFSRAIELNPNNFSAYLNRGQTYYLLKEYDQALIDLNHLIHNSLVLSPAYFIRGLTNLELGNYQQAVSDWEQARKDEIISLIVAEREQEQLAALESDDPVRFRRAAEMQLARRLVSLEQIDEMREIDRTYLTWAEYQLFVDDKRAQNLHYQPNYWKEYRFLKGEALHLAAGIQSEAAEEFCSWLNERFGIGVFYRLPTTDEAEQYQVLLPSRDGVRIVREKK